MKNKTAQEIEQFLITKVSLEPPLFLKFHFQKFYQKILVILLYRQFLFWSITTQPFVSFPLISTL